MKKTRKTFKFTQIALYSYAMLSFILDNWRPWQWSQDSRIILIVWTFVFFTIVEFIDNFRDEKN